LRERFPDPRLIPFVLLGDCNEVPSGPAVQTLRRRGRTEVLRLAPAADERGDTWTHHYRRGEIYARVDLILLSPALVPWLAAPGQILDGSDVRRASDHRPVVLELEPGSFSGG
jgi:endonuclease/exonuclease/phosphatase family metal-dependent hydrolase